MRVWMGLAALLFGSILGTFGGAGVFHWVHGSPDGCAQLLKGAMTREVVCPPPPSDRTYVLVGIALGVLLCSVWTWWMLRRE
jgi:hypothetical protein